MAIERKSPSYDISQSYDWNFDRAPQPVQVECQPIGGAWELAGLSVPSPLGIAAGPLLNGDWCRYYATLGFDLVTYKTVRSRDRKSYPLPNLVPIRVDQPLRENFSRIASSSRPENSWAISFGMPSRQPEYWRADVRRTRDRLPLHVKLSVSVVGTVEDDAGLSELAEDYALCASWAAESGADLVEANFSCPNVSTQDGQLYQNTDDAALVARTIRAAVPDTPLLIKIGYLNSDDEIRKLTDALGDHCDALVTTNGLSAYILTQDGASVFGGEARGVGGAAIRDASLRQVGAFRKAIDQAGSRLELIGVGGIFDAQDVRAYLNEGAVAIQIATAAMLNPHCGIEMREQLSASGSIASRKSSPSVDRLA